jgi:hypothetical protein
MQCALCETRSAIGYCGTCRTLLCEVCGQACAGCGKGMCPSHRAQAPNGKALCPACFAAHQARGVAPTAMSPARAAAAAPPPPPAPPSPSAAPASTSFSDLLADLGPPVISAPPPTAQEAPLSRPLVPTDDDAARAPSLDEIEARAMALLEQSIQDERHNARLLTASASRGTPMWLSGAFIGGLACVLLLLMQGGSQMWEPLRYVVLLVGMGAVIWNGYGFYSPGQPAKSRNLCLIGLALGIVAVGVTFLRWNG